MDNDFQPDGIVVGVDASPDARAAAEWAAGVATGSRIPLHLVAARSPETDDGWDHDHVSSKSSLELHRALLEHLRADLLAAHPELQLSTAASQRLPASALVLRARRSRLVVLGSHGESVLRWSLGSTSHQVAVHSPCSVAVVRSRPSPALRRILVGADDPAETTPVEWALREAGRTSAEVLVLHAFDRGEERAGVDRTQTEAALDRSVRRIADRYPDLKVRTLLHQAADHDLVVVGARGSGGFPGLTLGHVAGAVLQRADSTVVIAR